MSFFIFMLIGINRNWRAILYGNFLFFCYLTKYPTRHKILAVNTSVIKELTSPKCNTSFNPRLRNCANISLPSHATEYSDNKVPASTQQCNVPLPCRSSSRHYVNFFSQQMPGWTVHIIQNPLPNKHVISVKLSWHFRCILYVRNNTVVLTHR
jgi:hypothetical protein